MSTSSLRPANLTLFMGLLFFVSFFNYMDRYMLAVLLPSIKDDLSLTDTQIGFISGLAFTLFYATLGIPIARLADRYSRRRIIAVALAVWSVMTAACGFAQNFIQLALARVLVGVGEAGASPPSHSLISDCFPVSKRARAISIFSLGAPIGILVGFSLGGWLSQNFSWRIALYVVGIPGIILAGLILRFLYEPTRGAADGIDDDGETVPVGTAIAALLQTRAYRHMCIATGLYTVLYLGVIQWIPSYFTRSFGFGIATVGTWLALILSVSQLLGMLLGGYFADRFGKRDLRWYAWVPMWAMLISTPIFAVTFLTKNATVAFVSLFFPFMIGVMQGPPSFAAVQGLADLRMRATAAALFLLIVNLIGGGIGPQAVGILSDQLGQRYGDDSLRYALLYVSLLFGLWAAIHYYLSSRTIRDDFKIHRSGE